MRASKVLESTLQSAANEISVGLECDAIGRQFRVKLYPETRDAMYRPACRYHREHGITCHCRRWPDARGDAKYQRSSASMFRNGQRVHAVCWHGFRDFFRAVYRIEPMARFVTAMDTWKNADDFEARFRETGHKNIGSQFAPVAAAEACRCPESGSVGTVREVNSDFFTAISRPLDTYGKDEADGASCRAMANALRVRS